MSGELRPAILIIEPRREVADAIGDVIASAHYEPVIRPHLERLSDLAMPIAAIVIRIAFEGVSEPPHAAIARLPASHPPVVAIVREEKEWAEARRLKCDVILRAPDDLGQLCGVLERMIQA